MRKISARIRLNNRNVILIGLAVILLGFVGWYIWTRNDVPAISDSPYPTSFIEFSGTVTAMNNGCAHDDVCTVSVDGKVIVTGSGLSSDNQANVFGTVDADLAVGDKVQVKAKHISVSPDLTLQKCSECYVTRGSVRHQ